MERGYDDDGWGIFVWVFLVFFFFVVVCMDLYKSVGNKNVGK